MVCLPTTAREAIPSTERAPAPWLSRSSTVAAMIAACLAALRRLALDWLHEELDLIEGDLSGPEASREMATNYSRVFNQMNHYGWSVKRFWKQ